MFINVYLKYIIDEWIGHSNMKDILLYGIYFFFL